MMLEATSCLSMTLQRYGFELDKDAADVGMEMGATIHTAEAAHEGEEESARGRVARSSRAASFKSRLDGYLSEYQISE